MQKQERYVENYLPVVEAIAYRVVDSWTQLKPLSLPSGGSLVKNPPANAGDTGDTVPIPGSGNSPRGGNGNPLQYSCLENSIDRGA